MTSENRAIPGTSGEPEGELTGSDMDLSKTRFIDRIFAGKGEMGAMVRTLDWPAAVLGPLLSASRAARRRRISRTTMRSPTSGELRLRNWRRIHSITKEVRVGFRRPG